MMILQTMLQAQLICDHRDEFGIGRFGFGGADRIGENFIDRVDIAPIPCYFNRIARSTRELVVM